MTVSIYIVDKKVALNQPQASFGIIALDASLNG